MKTFLTILALAACSLVARAQTNITFNILVEEPTRTNTVSLPLTQLHVSGFNLNWEAHKAATGTNALAFRFFVRQETRDRLESLKTEARAAEFKAAKIDAITASILSNWDNATAADRKLLTDWLTKYPPQ